MSVFDSIIKLIKNHQTARSSAAWTSATALNTALTLAVTNYNRVVVSFYESDSGSAVLNAGVLTFETDDGSGQWYPMIGSRVGSNVGDATYAVVGGKQLWQFDVAGSTNFRIRVSTVLGQGAGTGTATANISVQASAGGAEPGVVASQGTASNLQTAMGSWLGSSVPTVGSKTSANSIPVVVASDQGAVAVNATLQTGTNSVGNTGAVAVASGGYSKANYNAQTTTVRTVKASAGKLGGWYFYNPNSSVAYVQIFDNSGTVTLGTTTPDIVLGIPANSGANLMDSTGIDFANAIKFACTTTETGSTAPSTGLTANLFYK